MCRRALPDTRVVVCAVEGGHRALKYNRLSGLNEDILPEGTHIRVPWFERPIIFDIRSRPRNIASLTGSRDLQMVNITLRVIYKCVFLPAL